MHMQRVKSAQANEIRALKRMKDREIDTTDIPPVLDWSKSVVGKLSADQEAPHNPVRRGRSGVTQRARQGLSDANQRPIAKFDGAGPGAINPWPGLSWPVPEMFQTQLSRSIYSI